MKITKLTKAACTITIAIVMIILSPKNAKADVLDDMFITDGVLKQYFGPEVNVTIPDNITSIGDHAFTNLTIYCNPGSAADYFAFALQIPCIYINGKNLDVSEGDDNPDLYEGEELTY